MERARCGEPEGDQESMTYANYKAPLLPPVRSHKARLDATPLNATCSAPSNLMIN